MTAMQIATYILFHEEMCKRRCNKLRLQVLLCSIWRESIKSFGQAIFEESPIETSEGFQVVSVAKEYEAYSCLQDLCDKKSKSEYQYGKKQKLPYLSAEKIKLINDILDDNAKALQDA